MTSVSAGHIFILTPTQPVERATTAGIEPRTSSPKVARKKEKKRTSFQAEDLAREKKNEHTINTKRI